MGAKPSKPVRKKPSYMPPSPATAPETSYRSTFRGDVFKQMETLQVDGNSQQITLAEKSDPTNMRTKGETLPAEGAVVRGLSTGNRTQDHTNTNTGITSQKIAGAYTFDLSTADNIYTIEFR
ncbi:UNVERIFIED_CONTAM: hypothetical protein FKN15_032644 [Acipenser sinensis]